MGGKLLGREEVREKTRELHFPEISSGLHVREHPLKVPDALRHLPHFAQSLLYEAEFVVDRAKTLRQTFRERSVEFFRHRLADLLELCLVAERDFFERFRKTSLHLPALRALQVAQLPKTGLELRERRSHGVGHAVHRDEPGLLGFSHVVKILREGRHLTLLQGAHGFPQPLFAREHGVRDLVGRNFGIAPHGKAPHKENGEQQDGKGGEARQDP